MSRFKCAVLIAVGMTPAFACSNSEPAASAPSGSQALPLAVATAPAAVPTAAPTGVPIRVPTTAASPSTQPSNVQLALGDPNELSTLRGIAVSVAATAGVTSPKTVKVVAASDHQAAEFIVSGAIINDHAPVYVIKATGGPFTADHHPPGMPAPQGSFLTVTVDATTHRVTDIGLFDAEPDLSKIGSFTADL